MERRYEGNVRVTQELLTHTENGFDLLERRISDIAVRAVKLVRERLAEFKGDVFVELTISDTVDSLAEPILAAGSRPLDPEEFNCMCSLCGHKHYDSGQAEEKEET